MRQGFRGYFSHIIIVTAAISATMGVAQVQAGEVLRLKAGQKTIKEGSLIGSEGKSEFVVQFQGPITEADRKDLRTAGFKILSYIPDDALVVYGDAIRLKGFLKASASVRAAQLFEPKWKQSDLFEPMSVFNTNRRVRVHIRLAKEEFAPSVRRSLSKLKDTETRMASGKVFVVDVLRSDIDAVSAFVGVEWIEPLPVIESMMMDIGGHPKARSLRAATTTGFESGAKLMNFEAAWMRGYAGRGETVAMADTGLDSGDLSTLHADLKNTIEASNVTFLPFTWSDTNGHGTHVAGSVQGTGAQSNGLIKGGAHEAKFIAQAIMVPFLGILDPNALQDPNGLVSPTFQKGARIHTNSWGADAKGAYDAMAAGFDDYMWNNPDMLMVFAAGNSGADENSDGRVDEGSIGSPASAKNVLTVGASENLLDQGGIQEPLSALKVADKFKAEPLKSDRLSNNPNGIAAFSSRGPTQDGRIKPDVVAPGTNIVATRSSAIQADPNGAPPLWGEYDANYLYCGGTSMATPLAAGAAVVARQFIRNQMGVPNPSAALVKAALMHTAYDMYPGQFGTGPKQELQRPGPNPHQGYGRVDMDALTMLDGTTLAIDERAGVGLNEEMTYTIASNTGIKATLVYTDAPGAANAAKALVNDIDLQIVSPGGQLVASNDRTNNAETLTAQGAGSYTISVKGVNIPNGKAGKQPFALLISPY